MATVQELPLVQKWLQLKSKVVELIHLKTTQFGKLITLSKLMMSVTPAIFGSTDVSGADKDVNGAVLLTEL